MRSLRLKEFISPEFSANKCRSQGLNRERDSPPTKPFSFPWVFQSSVIPHDWKEIISRIIIKWHTLPTATLFPLFLYMNKQNQEQSDSFSSYSIYFPFIYQAKKYISIGEQNKGCRKIIKTTPALAQCIYVQQLFIEHSLYARSSAKS